MPGPCTLPPPQGSADQSRQPEREAVVAVERGVGGGEERWEEGEGDGGEEDGC